MTIIHLSRIYSQLSTPGNRARNDGWEGLTTKTITLTLDESMMAWLQEISRSEEGIVPIQSIYQREVVFVLLDSSGEVGEFFVNCLTQGEGC
jgi:hypothetical protein